MKLLTIGAALLLAASVSLAESGVLLPGQDIRFGNIHVANLPGAGGNVNYLDNGVVLTLVVHDEAYCAVLKTGPETQSRRVRSVTLGGGYYAQGNISGAYIAVIGDNAVVLSLALRGRHRNNGNTIDLLGNGNIAATARWCYGRGEVLMNKIRFGLNTLFSASLNDAYISGDREGTFDLAWANRTVDVAGVGNRTIAFDGFPCRTPDREVDERPADLARDFRTAEKKRPADTTVVAR